MGWNAVVVKFSSYNLIEKLMFIFFGAIFLQIIVRADLEPIPDNYSFPF
jgi:hypothetical protein